MTVVIEENDVELKQLYWSCRRGLRELDELFQAYLKKEGAGLSSDERDEFRLLLKLADQTLLEYLMGRKQPDDLTMVPIIERIRAAI